MTNPGVADGPPFEKIISDECVLPHTYGGRSVWVGARFKRALNAKELRTAMGRIDHYRCNYWITRLRG